MATIPKKVSERFVKGTRRFKRILKSAHDRDLNEADTVSIVTDILGEILGYDKYTEITSEFAIRNTFCDIAVKIGEKVQFLVEVKAIGLTLKDDHLRQAIGYGVRMGVQWVILTNGVNWNLFRLKFEKPVSHDLVSSMDFLSLDPRKAEDQEKLLMLSREGVVKSVRDDVYERVQSVNRFVIAGLCMRESTLAAIRRDIRKLSPGLKVRTEEIERILKSEVLKRDTIEGNEAQQAAKEIRKAFRKLRKAIPKKQLTDVGGATKPIDDTTAGTSTEAASDAPTPNPVD